LIVAVAIAHSYLGERYILIRLFRHADLPKLFGNAEFTPAAPCGLHGSGRAGAPAGKYQHTCRVVGCTFLAHVLVALIGSRGKHLSWPVFLAIGVIDICATRT
jgi:hypothetical protein